MRLKTILGLSIKPDAIRLMQLRHQRNRFAIDWTIAEPLPEGAVDTKIILWESVETSIKNLVDRVQCNRRAVAINLPHSLVKFQKLLLPKGLSEEAIVNEIKRRIGQETKSTAEKFAIDYTVCSVPEQSESIIFCAITHQQYLSDYINCVENAGLSVKIVDIDVYAITRALQYEINLNVPQIDEHKKISNWIIFYLTEQDIQIIAFDTYHIFYHQVIDHEESDFDSQLHYLTQTFQGVFSEANIDQIILCAQKEWINKLHSHALTLSNSIHHVTNLTHIPASADGMFSNSLPWIPVFGLAMRELPSW